MNSNSQIHLLPEHIIDQIKAGEVIERPSTLLKEIIENSIDAGSDKIDIHIINNGLDLISIIDNGKGINPSDLPLAFCRHATSKISRFEDIYRLHSYGFRGEALASIASISKITCESHQQKKSGFIKIEGGQTISHREEDNSSNEMGTHIYIKDLFFNTPVRMKFIQSKTAEKNQINKILNSFLILNPQINFSIKWDDLEKTFYPAREQKDQRILDVIKSKEAIKFYTGNNSYDGVHFEVFLSDFSNRGNAYKSHFIFINNRFVQDIQLHKIILNSASSLWPEGETGHYVAIINVPPDEIDVNIHPNKTQIKLFRAPKVYSVVSSTIKQIQAQLNFTQPSTPVEKAQEFDFNQNEMKDISYKSMPMTQEEGLDTFFDQLHTHQNTEHTAYTSERIIKNYNNYCLIQIENDLAIIKHKDFFKEHIIKLFKSTYSTDQIIPLMVSRPIKFKGKKNFSNDFLQEIGFEIDQINTDTVLLRSFPKVFQNFPYLRMLEDNILCQEINQLNFDFLNDFQMNESQFFSLLKDYGINNLREKSLLLYLNEDHLKQIYEKK